MWLGVLSGHWPTPIADCVLVAKVYVFRYTWDLSWAHYTAHWTLSLPWNHFTPQLTYGGKQLQVRASLPDHAALPFSSASAPVQRTPI